MAEEEDGSETEEFEVTSIDPLNLAITAKSSTSRLWWSFVTIAAIVTLISLIVLQVNIYNRRPTHVLTKIKINRSPFPAVTFCNMNPYKQSAISSMPELGQLEDAYDFVKASPKSAKATNKTNEENDLSSKRRKRSNPVCSCTGGVHSYNNPVTATPTALSSSTFTYYPHIGVYWNCSNTCCANKAPIGKSSRTAWITSDALFQNLRSAGVIPDYATMPDPSYAGWIGLFSPTPGNYYWYNDTTTQTGCPVSVGSSSCTNCQVDPAMTSWNSTSGGVATWYRSGKILFSNLQTRYTYSIICEYYTPTSSETTDCPTSTTTSSTKITSSSPTTLTSKSTSVTLISTASSASAITATSTSTASQSTMLASLPNTTATSIQSAVSTNSIASSLAASTNAITLTSASTVTSLTIQSLSTSAAVSASLSSVMAPVSTSTMTLALSPATTQNSTTIFVTGSSAKSTNSSTTATNNLSLATPQTSLFFTGITQTVSVDSATTAIASAITTSSNLQSNFVSEIPTSMPLDFSSQPITSQSALSPATPMSSAPASTVSSFISSNMPTALSNAAENTVGSVSSLASLGLSFSSISTIAATTTPSSSSLSQSVSTSTMTLVPSPATTQLSYFESTTSTVTSGYNAVTQTGTSTPNSFSLESPAASTSNAQFSTKQSTNAIMATSLPESTIKNYPLSSPDVFSSISSSSVNLNVTVPTSGLTASQLFTTQLETSYKTFTQAFVPSIIIATTINDNIPALLEPSTESPQILSTLQNISATSAQTSATFATSISETNATNPLSPIVSDATTEQIGSEVTDLSLKLSIQDASSLGAEKTTKIVTPARVTPLSVANTPNALSDSIISIPTDGNSLLMASTYLPPTETIAASAITSTLTAEMAILSKQNTNYQLTQSLTANEEKTEFQKLTFFLQTDLGTTTVPNSAETIITGVKKMNINSSLSPLVTLQIQNTEINTITPFVEYSVKNTFLPSSRAIDETTPVMQLMPNEPTILDSTISDAQAARETTKIPVMQSQPALIPKTKTDGMPKRDLSTQKSMPSLEISVDTIATGETVVAKTDILETKIANAKTTVGIETKSTPFAVPDAKISSQVTDNLDDSMSNYFSLTTADNLPLDAPQPQQIQDFPNLNMSNPSTKYIVNALDDVKSDSSAMSATSEDMVAYIMASMPLEKAIAAGYTLSELIMQCVYNGVRCTLSDFTLQVDPNYGNCYTFNTYGQHILASQAGMGKGLSVTLLVGENQYLNFVQASGVRVVVHKQNEPLFPDTQGFTVPSGYQTTAGLKQIFTSSINKSCARFPNDVSTYNYQNTSYAKEACLRSCYQKSVIEKCNCGDPRVPLPNSTFSFCDVTKRGCVNSYYTVDSKSASTKCSCPVECTTDTFETTLSKTEWANSYIKDWQSFLGNGTDANGRNQLAKIDVHFEDLILVEYIECEAYDIFEVLWDISSVAGLFLGVSVMSLFEVSDLMQYLFKKRNQ